MSQSAIAFPTHPPFLSMQWDLPANIRAACTTRLGGVSSAPFDSFNLGDHVQDAPQAVAANRAQLSAHLQGATPVFLTQVHGTAVAQLSASHAQTNTQTQPITADASFTSAPRVACTILVADCLPVLFTDDQGQCVAAAHAGWRGLAAGVLEQTVQALCAEAHTTPAHVRAWLGPCIGPQAFEVGGEVREAFMSMEQQAGGYFQKHPSQPGKWLADLAGLARLRLQALGLSAISGNDGTPAWCTVSQPSAFFSYRRDGITGRFGVCIWRDG